MKNDVPETANRLSSFLLFSTVALAPLPFGSTDPLATAAWSAVLGVAMIFLRPTELRSGHLILLSGAAAVVAGYVIVLHEQLAASRWFASSAPHPLWQTSSQLLEMPLASFVSVARNQPFLSLGAPIASFLALLCGFFVCVEPARARQLLKVVAWSGAIYAVFGIISFAFDPAKVLWRDKQAYTTVLTATFINRNTAAVYFGACALIWQLNVCEKLVRVLADAPRELRTWLHLILFSRSHKTRVATLMFTVCLAAMFLTGSRAGVVCSLGMLVFAPLLLLRRQLPRKSTAILAIACGLLVVLILLETIGAGVNTRFDLDRLADGGRLETYRSTLRMIGDHPWLGTGLGTFPWTFPAYRSGAISIWGVWDRAHNTPLEFASELGVPLLILVVLGWIMALVVLANGVRVRRRDVVVPLSGLMIGLLALVHSMIDFSLQVPGFAIVVFAVVGAGLSQSFRTKHRPVP